MVKNQIEESISKLDQEHAVHYPAFLKALAGIAVLKGATHIHEFANNAYEQIVGMKITHGKTVQELFPEIGQQSFVKIFDDVFLTGKPFIADEQMMTLYAKTGNISKQLILNMVVLPLKDEKGNTEGLIISIVNVKAPIKERNKIQSSEFWLRNLVMQSPVAMALILGPSFIVKLVNKKQLEIWHKEEQEVLNKQLFVIFPELKSHEFKRLLTDVYTTGIPFHGKEIAAQLFRNGSLETLYYDFIYDAMKDETGVVLGIIVISVDVTEKVIARKLTEESEAFNHTFLESKPDYLKLLDLEGQIQHKNVDITEKRLAEEKIVQCEKHFRSLSENSPDVISLHDKDFRYLYVSSNIETITGIKAEQFLGKTYREVGIPEEMCVFFDEQISIAFKKRALHTIEFKAQNGEYLYARLLPDFNEKGQPQSILIINTNLSERKQAEEKIKESEAKYRGLFEAINQGLSVVEMIFDENKKPVDYRFIENNPTFHAQTGLPDVSGKSVREVIPDLEDFWFDTYGKVALTGEPIRFTHHAESLNSWFEVYAFRSGAEEKNKVAILFTNVTQRKKVEDTIRESEEKIRSFILQAPVAMCFYRGPEFRIEIVNEEMLSIWDKPLNSVINKPVFDAMPEARGQGFEALLEKVYRTGEKFSSFGTPITLHRNGKRETIYVNLVYQPHRETNGTISGIVEVASNVTEQVAATQQLEASENQFRTFADTIQNLAWIADGDGWIYWYNQQWYDYTGTSLKEMQGWGWNKVHHPDHIENVVNFVTEAWKKDEAFELTFPLRRFDGEYRWFLTRAYPVKDASGNIERWVGTNTDIHEQKTIEQNKDEFISIASHEMKTPLTTAKSYIDLMLLSLNDHNQTTVYATKAIRSIERLNDLVTELLDSSKIQNGQLDYHITSFDLNKMADETIENIQQSTKTHIIQKSGYSSKEINGDRGRLQQVLMNLLSNAIKYSPQADSVLIEIEEHNNFINVAIKDFGIGMSGKHLDKVFDRYYRVQEHAMHFQGLGIGLYISSNIIQRHGGRMWVESEPGKGSTFYFNLPI